MERSRDGETVRSRARFGCFAAAEAPLGVDRQTVCAVFVGACGEIQVVFAVAARGVALCPSAFLHESCRGGARVIGAVGDVKVAAVVEKRLDEAVGVVLAVVREEVVVAVQRDILVAEAEHLRARAATRAAIAHPEHTLGAVRTVLVGGRIGVELVVPVALSVFIREAAEAHEHVVQIELPDAVLARRAAHCEQTRVEHVHLMERRRGRVRVMWPATRSARVARPAPRGPVEAPAAAVIRAVVLTRTRRRRAAQRGGGGARGGPPGRRDERTE